MVSEAAIVDVGLFSPAYGKKSAVNKSSTTEGERENAFFHPKMRTRLAVLYLKHLQTLGVSLIYNVSLSSTIILRELHRVTFTYRRIKSNEILCEHYYMSCRKLGLIEVVFFAGVYFKDLYLGVKDMKHIFFLSLILSPLIASAVMLPKALRQIRCLP